MSTTGVCWAVPEYDASTGTVATQIVSWYGKSVSARFGVSLGPDNRFRVTCPDPALDNGQTYDGLSEAQARAEQLLRGHLRGNFCCSFPTRRAPW